LSRRELVVAIPRAAANIAGRRRHKNIKFPGRPSKAMEQSSLHNGLNLTDIVELQMELAS
jgi:hypothetical protein